MGVARDALRAFALPRGSWRTLGRAIVELGLARLRLRADHRQHLLQPRSAPDTPPPPLTEAQRCMVDAVAFAIPRAATRVPWRADCLVQALAGERWLRRRGIAAQIVIGVRKDGASALDAHAWLEADNHVVIGGDIAGFVPLAD